MNRHPGNEKPRVRGGAGIERKGSREYLNHAGALYGDSRASAYLPMDWRQRLPNPASYYAQHVAKLGSANPKGWAQGLCPFHEDHSPSLGVHVADGGAYRCMACGAKGRDVVAFHMARTGYDFKEAVRDLIGLEARA